MAVSEAAVCVDDESYCVTWTGVSVILSSPFSVMSKITDTSLHNITTPQTMPSKIITQSSERLTESIAMKTEH